jgi:hypothetical protein
MPIVPGLYCVEVTADSFPEDQLLDTYATMWDSFCGISVGSGTPPAPTLQMMMSVNQTARSLTSVGNVAGTTPTLVIGQELTLAAGVSNGSVGNYTYAWSVPANTAGSDWNDVADSTQGPPPALTAAQLAGNSIDFRWTDCSGGASARTASPPNCPAGTVTLTATPIEGSGAPPLSPVSAQFSIQVPQITPVAQENGSISVPAPGTLALPSATDDGFCVGLVGTPSVCLNNASNTTFPFGMVFSLPAGGPTGRYEWVQVVNKAVWDQTDGYGNVCAAATSGHDNAVPTDNSGGVPHDRGGLLAWDAPSIPLSASYPKVTLNFGFTTTLMFVPTNSTGENVGTYINQNDVGTLVPLFTIGWSWLAEADLVAGSSPVVWAAKTSDDGLGNPTDPAVGTTSSYPRWTQVVNTLADCNPLPPVIVSVSPSSGPVGTKVTITGNNFGAAQGTSTVMFDAATATASAGGWGANGNSITVVVPNLAAGTVNVRVTVGGVASAPFPFTVTQ